MRAFVVSQKVALLQEAQWGVPFMGQPAVLGDASPWAGNLYTLVAASNLYPTLQEAQAWRPGRGASGACGAAGEDAAAVCRGGGYFGRGDPAIEAVLRTHAPQSVGESGVHLETLV